MLDLSGLAFTVTRLQDKQVLGLRIQERCGLLPLTEDNQASLAWFSHLQSKRQRGDLSPELATHAADYRAALDADSALLDRVDCQSCKARKLCPNATTSTTH